MASPLNLPARRKCRLYTLPCIKTVSYLYEPPARPAKTKMVSRYATQPVSEILLLSEQQQDLLQRAITDWHDLALFPDDQVLQVKSIARRIFDLPDDATLVGSTVPDAIILQTATDALAASRFCVLMRGDSDPNNADEWIALDLETEGHMFFPKTTPFKTVLYFLANSSGGLVHVSKRWPQVMAYA